MGDAARESRDLRAAGAVAAGAGDARWLGIRADLAPIETFVPTPGALLERVAITGHRLVLELLLDEDGLVDVRSPASLFGTLNVPIALSPRLLEAIETLRSEMDGTEEQERARATLVAAAAAVTGGSLTVGFVTWLLRSGLLLAAAASTTPLWRPLDPVPILSAARGRRDGADEGRGGASTGAGG